VNALSDNPTIKGDIARTVVGWLMLAALLANIPISVNWYATNRADFS
jgi:hypothetical protein